MYKDTERTKRSIRGWRAFQTAFHSRIVYEFFRKHKQKFVFFTNYRGEMWGDRQRIFRYFGKETEKLKVIIQKLDPQQPQKIAKFGLK